MSDIIFQIIRVLVLTTIAFIVAVLWTPLLTHFLYKYKLGKQIRSSVNTPLYSKLHRHKEGTPTMGGILIWGTVVFLAIAIWFLAYVFHIHFFEKINFLSRGQTFLPLGALILAAVIGLFDDILGVFRKGPNGGGISVKTKVIIYTAIAIIGAWWFYFKLDWTLLYIPFLGYINIGLWYIPLFIFIIVSTAFSANETDGLDGLAGGVLLVALSSVGAIAFLQGRYDLATLCGAITGALMAFLWFNIYPARFFMGDTGSMSLGISLGIIAMLTNSALFLPFFAFILVAESLSVIIQAVSKKALGRKIFLSTPIHHHFEAKGWPEAKITMRLWVISWVMAGLGLILSFISFMGYK